MINLKKKDFEYTKIEILKNNEIIRVYEKGFNLESDPDKFIFDDYEAAHTNIFSVLWFLYDNRHNKNIKVKLYHNNIKRVFPVNIATNTIVNNLTEKHISDIEDYIKLCFCSLYSDHAASDYFNKLVRDFKEKDKLKFLLFYLKNRSESDINFWLGFYNYDNLEQVRQDYYKLISKNQKKTSYNNFNFKKAA